MADKITDKVLDLIASVKRVPREKLTPDSTFDELGMDSLDAINLIFEIENEFNISVSDEAVKSITGVRDLVEKLQQIMAESSSGAAASGTA